MKLANFPGGAPALFAAAAAGILVHELVHLAVAKWLLRDSPPARAAIGFRGRYLLPYTTITGPVSVRHYRMIGLAPTLVLGLPPAALGLALGLPGAALFGAAMLAIAAGDLIVLFAIRRLSGQTLVHDHPQRVGCELA